MSVKAPWACFMWNKAERKMRFQGRKTTRRAAIGLVDRPYRSGSATVRNDNTGEMWERRRGSWFLVKTLRSKSKQDAPR